MQLKIMPVVVVILVATVCFLVNIYFYFHNFMPVSGLILCNLIGYPFAAVVGMIFHLGDIDLPRDVLNKNDHLQIVGDREMIKKKKGYVVPIFVMKAGPYGPISWVKFTFDELGGKENIPHLKRNLNYSWDGEKLVPVHSA